MGIKYLLKKHLLLTLLFLPLLIVNGCSDSGVDEGGSGSVSGQLTFQGNPLGSVRVGIGDILNWNTTTDDEGFFEINNVATGEHILRASFSVDDMSSSAIENKIFVSQGENDLGAIRLPVPSELFTPLINDENGVDLRWTATAEGEFREYKVYRKEDSGLDETTGELIHVTTSRNDTTFTDNNYSPGIESFYRVYTLSAFGKVGGSNLVSIKTDPINLVENGDFEQSEPGEEPDGWIVYEYNPQYGRPGKFVVDNNESFNGENSLQINIEPFESPGTGGFFGDILIRQEISGAKFEVGRKYTFTVSFKPQDFDMGAHIVDPGSNAITERLRVSQNDEWVTQSTEFLYPENTSIVTITIWAQGREEDETLYGWVDDVRIEFAN